MPEVPVYTEASHSFRTAAADALDLVGGAMKGLQIDFCFRTPFLVGGYSLFFFFWVGARRRLFDHHQKNTNHDKKKNCRSRRMATMMIASRLAPFWSMFIATGNSFLWSFSDAVAASYCLTNCTGNCSRSCEARYYHPTPCAWACARDAPCQTIHPCCRRVRPRRARCLPRFSPLAAATPR
jgi:hypothetical protein